MITLNVPFLTWSLIAVAMAVIAIIRIAGHIHSNRSHHKALISFGREDDEFYVPGDRLVTDDEDEYVSSYED